MSIFDQSIFRAYDIRGTYPAQINEKVAYAAGQAFVQVMQAKKVAVGRDVRSTGTSLQEAMIRGIQDAGASVIEIGVISTEMLYFAAATLECDGGMSITASHNPKEWNGIKFIGKGAAPLTKDGPLGEIYDFINSGQEISQFEKGTTENVDPLPAYREFLSKFFPTSLPPLKIVANTNFGANGRIIDAVLPDLKLDIVKLNWEADGTFPKGTPDPLLPHNRKELCELIVIDQADFGVAWDADADRAFFYDEKGRFFHGYYITALLIKHFLEQQPEQSVVLERRLTWANLDAVKQGNGAAVFSRTGHGYFKAAMRENNAVFGGETSGHYYYRDYFNCDCGLMTFLLILDVFGKQVSAGKKVSEILDYYMDKYPISPQELNYITPKADEIIKSAGEKYHDAEQNHVDGLSVEYPDWRFNLRMSSNEPVLRLNFEARSEGELEKRATELQEFIGSFGAELRNDN